MVHLHRHQKKNLIIDIQLTWELATALDLFQTNR